MGQNHSIVEGVEMFMKKLLPKSSVRFPPSVFTLLLVAVLVPLATAAQDAAPQKLPDTQAGRRVEAYVEAFNAGEEKMRRFFTDNVSPEALQQRPLEARLGVYRNVHGRLGAIKLSRILKSSESSIAALFEMENGDWVEIDFEFEPAPPHRFLSLRVEDAEPPAGALKSRETMSANAPSLTEADAVASIESQVNKAVAADEFSGVVLVARGGTPVFQKAYGLASREYNAPNRLDTKFNLGSIDKTFTQIAIAQLVAQGKLSYDDKLSKLLPDYTNREAAEKINVRQLLSHTSGIGDFFGAEFANASKDRFRSNKDFLPLFASKPLLFEPGASRRYSNGGYIVLGAIIEKVSGQDYYEYVREHIFKPAGMTDSDWYEQDLLPPNTADGYTRDEARKGPRRQNIFELPARGSAAGGGYSTAGDLLKFARALQAGTLRQPEMEGPRQTIAAEGTASKLTNAAQGNSGGLNGGLGIAGGSPGVNALLEILPNYDYTVVILSNYDPPSAEKLGRQIVQTLRQIQKK
jgi:CubicO group peptidase (beta-lactamase class C family)